jgi:PAS domain S-box-containing protein
VTEQRSTNPANGHQIAELVRQLAEAEAALQALVVGQADAVVCPETGTPLLLRKAQIELQHARDELEQRVQQRTADLERANEALRAEISAREHAQAAEEQLRATAQRERDRAEATTAQAQLANDVLSALLDNMPVGVVVADAEGRLLRTNASGEAILGRAVSGSVRRMVKTYTSYRPDGSLLPTDEMPLTRALEHGEVVEDVEVVIRRADGSERILVVGAAPVIGEDGNIACAVAAFQDITERERARAVLRGYADRLHVLYEMEQAILAARSPAEIAETALHHLEQLLPCPRAAVSTFDRPSNTMSLLALHGEGRMELPNGWQERLPLDGQLRSFRPGEVRLVADVDACLPPCPLQRAVDGHEVHACAQAPLFAQEELIGMLNLGLGSPASLSDDQVTLVREVADQLAIGIRQAQLYARVEHHAVSLRERVAERTAQLRASEAQLRAIFDGAGVGIAVIGAEGRLRDSNPALQRMLGYTGEALRGVAFSSFLHPDDYRPALAAYQKLLAEEDHSQQHTMEIRYAGGNGLWRWANATLSLVHEDGGRSHLAVAMLDDVTERKQAQEALLHSEKLALTGRLAGSLAHEINNPLQAVVGCLGLAYEMLDDNKDVQRYVEIATEELERVSRIVGRLHDLQRHANVGEREAANVNALLEDVFLLTDSRQIVQQIELQAALAEDLPALLVAPDRIRQVFLNVILNAIDAMPSGGTLRVCTARTQDPAGVTISISDTGSGIDADALSTLFEPMYSVKADGIGLGLYVARSIVESHRGRIRAESQPGKGTTFEIWLPA